MTKKVLLATYTHKVKYYCIVDWLKRIQLLMSNFDSVDFLLVDNSDERMSPSWLRLKMDGIFGKNKQELLWDHKMVGKNSRKKQCMSQQIIWDYALKKGYEKLLIIESDVFPKDDFTIQKMYDSQKAIVSGVFPLLNSDKGRKDDILCVMGYMLDSKLQKFWFPRWAFEKAMKKIGMDKPVKIYACGLGCIMIDKQVLERIFPEFASQSLVTGLKKVRKEISKMKKSNVKTFLKKQVKQIEKIQENWLKKKVHPDSNFHQNCELNGISRFVIPELDCEHRNIKWEDIEKTVKR